MLEYSKNLHDNIEKIIKYLIIGDKFRIIGSFGKNKYVTDIDITNYVSDKINFNNEIKKIINNLPSNIIFLNFTSGTKQEFKLPWNIINENNIENYKYIESINFINNLYFLKLINEKERDYCNNLLEQKPDINKLMLIEDKLYNKSKNKFSAKNIFNNVLTNEFIQNDNNVIHYIYKYNNEYVPIDVGLVKSNANNVNNMNKSYNNFNKSEYLMYLKKEYYFILSSMRRYLDTNDQIIVNNLLNNEYGSYRQILMNIFYLIQFINFPILQLPTYYELCYNVINKIKKYTKFDNSIIVTIEKLLEKRVNIKSEEWYNLLKELEYELTLFLNEKFMDHTNYYYKKISNKIKLKYGYLVFDKKLL